LPELARASLDQYNPSFAHTMFLENGKLARDRTTKDIAADRANDDAENAAMKTQAIVVSSDPVYQGWLQNAAGSTMDVALLRLAADRMWWRESRRWGAWTWCLSNSTAMKLPSAPHSSNISWSGIGRFRWSAWVPMTTTMGAGRDARRRP